MSELYPEAIYGTRNGGTMTPKQRDGFGGMARRYAYNLGYADGWVDRGKGVVPVPAGWSNLTEAIKAGERIDWERLEGVEAKCVHAEQGTLTHKLERDAECPPEEYTGWYAENCPPVWPEAFYCSWLGRLGWSLWVKGDIPLRKQTADQLLLGTCFRARYTKGDYVHTYSRAQVVQVNGEPRVICLNAHFSHVIATYTPAEVEVLEVYGIGTFQTPKENQ